MKSPASPQRQSTLTIRAEDDVLHATRTAVEDGILLGGGVALFKATLSLATNSLKGVPHL